MNDHLNDDAADALDQLGATTPPDQSSEASAALPPTAGPTTNTDPALLPRTNLLLGAIGACIGAILGAAVWVFVSQVTGFNIGYVAILVGAMAGWGAVLAAKVPTDALGYIAALAGAAAIVIGTYVEYHLDLHSEDTRAMLRVIFDESLADNPEAVDMTDAQRDEAFENFYQAVLHSDEMSFVNVMTDSSKDMAFLILFGAMGLYYGFRVGSGAGKRAGPRRSSPARG